jgi:hypothetical protein
MSSQPAVDFEGYARDCVKLAEQPHMPQELRAQLLEMAREWMQALLQEQDETANLVSNSEASPG